MQLFNSEKLNSFLAETVHTYLSRVNRNGNGNGKQALTWEEAWEKVAEEYTKFVCSLEPADFSKLRLVVDPGTRSDNTATWLFKDGCYQEVKLKHFLSQQVKLLLEQDLSSIFGLNKSEITSLFLKYYDDSLINSYAKKLTAFSPQREEVNWNFYIRRGLDVIWLSDGKRILVSDEGEITVEKQHNDHNLFAIPANISTKSSYKEPSFFLNLVHHTFGEAAEAWLDLMALLLSPSDTSKIVTFLVGPANSGKSTWLDIFELVYGSNAVAPITLKHLNEKSFHLSRFLTRLIVFAHETSRERAEDSTLKWIASRDVLFVDRKFLSAIEGRAIARLVVATNNIPVISDYSDGFVERVWFFNLEKLKERLPKTTLFRKIEEEAADIRRYLILRLAHLRRNGLSEETVSYLKQARQKFLVLQNVVAAFLMQLWQGEINLGELIDNENLLRFYERKDGKLHIAAKLIWPLFVAWCRDVGREPLAKDNFLTAIQNLPTEYLPFRVSPNRQLSIRFKDKVEKGYKLVAKPVVANPDDSKDVTDVTSESPSEVTRKPLGDKGCNSCNSCNPAEVTNSSSSSKETKEKINPTQVTKVTQVTTLDNQGFQRNLQEKEEVTKSYKKETSPQLSPSCVASSFPSEQEPSSEEEGTIEEVLDLREQPEEEQEPYAEEEAAEEEEGFRVEEQSGEERTGIKERLLEGDKKRATERLLRAKFGVKGEPRCFNCSYAELRCGRWFCTMHKETTEHLGLCDLWEPCTKRPSQQTPSQEKQATQKQREERNMKEKKQATKQQATKQQATQPATKQQTRKQKQAKEPLQERVRRIVQSQHLYEEIIREGHEKLLEELLSFPVLRRAA